MSRSHWIVLAAAFFGSVAVTAWLSPIGEWYARFLAVELQNYSDPDGAYLTAGIALSLPADWPGHPGIPVVLVVGAVAQIVYGVAHAAGMATTYDAFVVRHLVEIAFVVRLVMALAHIGCIALVYRLSWQLIPSAAVAAVATLAYATSWQVLFYSKRISPEPFMVGLTIVSILLFFRWLDVAAHREARSALALAALTSAAIATGVLTKLTIVLPALVFLAGSILLVRRSFESEEHIAWPLRCAGLAIFIVTAALTLWLATAWLDWKAFFQYWIGFSDTGLAFDQGRSLSGNLATGLPSFLVSIMRKLTIELIAGATETWAQIHGHLVEAVYASVAMAGVFGLLRKQAMGRRRLRWIVLLALAMAPIPVFRNHMHYWFVHVAMAAPFFGWAVFALVEHLAPGHWSDRKKLVAALSLALLTHLASLGSWGLVNVLDARAYAAQKPCIDAVADTREGEQITVVGKPADPIKLHGMFFPLLPTSSSTRQAYESMMDLQSGLPRSEPLQSSDLPLVVLREDESSVCRVERGS